MRPGDDAAEAGWFDLEDMADADGMRIVRLVCERLCNTIEFRYAFVADKSGRRLFKFEQVVGCLAFDHGEMIARFLEMVLRFEADEAAKEGK